MDRRDPVQRHGDADAGFREVVDWEPRSVTGRLLRLGYPILAWIGLLAVLVLLFGASVSTALRFGYLGTLGGAILGGGVVAAAVVVTVGTALLSPKPASTGPPVGAILSSEQPHARVLRLSCVFGGAVVLVVQVVAAEFVFFTDPIILGFVGLSVLPALGLVVYIRRTDVTSPDPPGLLLFVFLLGIVLANLAAIANTAVEEAGLVAAAGDQLGDAVAVSLYFLFVVGPVEELVKLLAGTIYTYRSEEFDAVAAGAVYGAVAGLGFATIENAIFITEEVVGAASRSGALADGGSITVGRAFAGPGHVIWSGIAGYYLGLARFNSRFAGPLVCKGLLIAVILHGVYNVSVQFVLVAVARAVPLSVSSVFVSFAVAYHGLAFGFLLFKLLQYRDAHRDAHNGAHIESELAEFDP